MRPNQICETESDQRCFKAVQGGVEHQVCIVPELSCHLVAKKVCV